MSTSKSTGLFDVARVFVLLLTAVTLLGVPTYGQELAPIDGKQAYYTLPISELTILEGELPATDGPIRYNRSARRKSRVTRPYATLDGPGDAYLQLRRSGTWRINGDAYRQATLAVSVPEGSDSITGQLYLPNPDWSGMFTLKFKVAQDEKKSDKQAFLRQKMAHYEQLLQSSVPGAAWFRHQVALIRKELGREPRRQGRNGRPPARARSDHQFQRSFAMLSGGRALSENLQLDRLLPTTAPEAEKVAIDAIEGITVTEFDWASMVGDLEPELDPLARLIPDDQHALFFSSFQALVDLSDHATLQATPILRMVEPRGENAKTQLRYETQLGLSLGTLARMLGPQVVESVALTGADPYLRTGADVALLFEPKNQLALEKLLQGQLALAAKENSEAEEIRGNVHGIDYSGVRSADRTICSYQSTIGDAVVVTNSLAQLRRLIDVFRGKQPSLATLPEYAFFRDRYRRGHESETALLMISDKTIRRWCGPRWRIGASRRVRAAAVMTQLQAEHLDQLVSGDTTDHTTLIQPSWPIAGQLSLRSDGVQSDLYNTLEFQTPILELDIAWVTKAEEQMYRRWRDGYQRNWSGFFDPIAIRFTASKDRLATDVTVMPLIDRSRYRQFENVTQGAKISEAASDRHAGSLLHWAMAINKDSETVQQASNMARMFAPQIKANPLAWLGETITFYADEDPFWQELAETKDAGDFMQDHYHRLPVALQFEVTSGFKLTGFLAVARAWIEQTAPGMTIWETKQHADEAYVKVSPSEKARSDDDVPEQLALYYAATGKSLVVTLSEEMLKRALDRQIAHRQDKEEGIAKQPIGLPWLGENMGLQVEKDVVEMLANVFGDDYQLWMQTVAWNNIPILNEWKQQFSDADPVQLHEQFWQRRLVSPGGGSYRWNAKWQTMESTLYGHPGEPKRGPTMPPSLSNLTRANFGLTFEEHGLRARMELNRQSQSLAGVSLTKRTPDEAERDGR